MNIPTIRSDDYGELQKLVEKLFDGPQEIQVDKLEILTQADIFDLCQDLQEVVDMLPSRRYTRQRLCDQFNSILTAHGWGAIYGTVE